MRRRRILILLAIPVVMMMAAGIAIVSMFMNAAGSDTGLTDALGGDCTTTVDSGAGITHVEGTQLENARVITAVGKELGIPGRGIVIAIATSLQESGLRNLDHGDRDSVGLFQQRPSAGWGTVAELTSPPIATRKFYTALLAVAGWQSMPLTRAAQAVQRSAFPLAYAKWESLATTLAGAAAKAAGSVAGAVVGQAVAAAAVPGTICGTLVNTSLPAGVVGTMLRAALAQQGKPYVWGATGPSVFDCSGLVVYAWRLAGFRLTIRTADQMYRAATRVTPGSEQAGDLLFGEFGPGGAGHVMIVVRPGLAVEAPHTGDVVRLQPYAVGSSAWVVGRLPSNVLIPVPAVA